MDQIILLLQLCLKWFSTFLLFSCCCSISGWSFRVVRTNSAWKSWILMTLNCWVFWPVWWIKTLTVKLLVRQILFIASIDYLTEANTLIFNVCGSHRVEDYLQRCSLRWNSTVVKLREAPKVQITSTCLWSEGLSFTAIMRYEEITGVISFVLYHHCLLAWCLQIFDKGDSMLPDIQIFIFGQRRVTWNSCPKVEVKYLE